MATRIPFPAAGHFWAAAQWQVKELLESGLATPAGAVVNLTNDPTPGARMGNSKLGVWVLGCSGARAVCFFRVYGRAGDPSGDAGACVM